MIANVKRLLLAVLACALLLCSLSACSGGFDRDDAEALATDFIEAIAAEDYERAQNLLHPSVSVDARRLVEEVELDEGIDFSSGVVIESKRQTEMGGNRCEITFLTQIGGRRVEIEVDVVKNEKGYGIWGFDADA